VPYFALCLFAGIRPGVPYGEITKLPADGAGDDPQLDHGQWPKTTDFAEPRVHH
jgi:hypothetical protein